MTTLVDVCGRAVPRPAHLLRMRAAIVAVTAAFLALTVAAAIWHEQLVRFDEPVSDALRGSLSVEFWRAVTLPGATEFYVPVAAVAAVVLWNRCRSLAVMWPALIVAGAVVNVSLKWLVDRPRPTGPETGVALAAFPSGHTIHATVVLGLIPPTLYLLTKRSMSAWIAYPVLLGAATLTGLSRVALGAHWLTDVVAGHLIGLALLIAADLAVELHRAETMPRLGELHPDRWPASAVTNEPLRDHA